MAGEITLENYSIEQVQTVNPLEQLARAEVDIQISTAKRYPRVISKVRERILDIATSDKTTAEKCFYALPRDGKVISGPSVRLAEIVAASYQNLKCGARVIGQDATSITCQGVCTDMENNVSATVEVRRKIIGRNGQKYSEDMVNTTANAGCSIALRNAIFRVVPMALFKEVSEQIKQVGMGDERTVAEKRNAALAWFKARGVAEKEVVSILNANDEEGRVRKGNADLSVEDITTLRGFVQAINEGTTSLDDIRASAGTLKAEAPAAATKAVAAAKAAGAKAKKAAAKPAEDEPAPAGPKPTTDEDIEVRTSWLRGAANIVPAASEIILAAGGVERIAADAVIFESVRSKINAAMDKDEGKTDGTGEGAGA
jgi:hypothetical protein